MISHGGLGRTSRSVQLSKPLRISLLIVALSLSACSSGRSRVNVKEEPATTRTTVLSKSPDALKILLVGNRIIEWHEMPRIFVSLIKRADPSRPLKVSYVVGSDYTLQNHLDEGSAMKAISQQGPWDFVVLQGKTYSEFDDDYVETVRKFIPAIVAAKAQPVLFQNYVDHPGDVSDSQEKFDSATDSLKIKLLPLGNTWAEVRRRFDKVELYDEDRHHPSLKGSYLIACAIYSFCLKKPVIDLPVDLDYVDATDKTKTIFDNAQEARDLKLTVEQTNVGKN